MASPLPVVYYGAARGPGRNAAVEMLGHLSLAAPFEFAFDAGGLAVGDAVDDAVKFAVGERRLAPRAIPGVQQAAHELVIARVTEEMAGDPGRRRVAIFGNRLARELRPDVRRNRLGRR